MLTNWPDEVNFPRCGSESTSAYTSQTSASGWHSITRRGLTRLYTQCTVRLTQGKTVTGKELRGIRKRLGLTQVALAERLAVTSTTVARWERDEVPIREPMARLIRLLANTGLSPKPKRTKR